MINRIINYFPLGAIILAVTAYYYNEFFSNLSFAIIPLLSIVMFGMGITLRWTNFKSVIQQPRLIGIGVLLQFLIMPTVAFLISSMLNLNPAITTGIVLVGCSPGGTASNVITYLAKGNVALSITLTLTSTLLAVILTPILTYVLLNNLIPVPALDMFLSILQIIIIPVVVGTAINSLWGDKLKQLRNIAPLISTLSIILIIAIITAMNKSKLGEVDIFVILAVILHNISGLGLGYFFAKILSKDESISRTIAIEVGMQNSGLAVALAVKYFSVAAALPGAIFSIWHNLSGSLLAGYWRNKGNKK